MSAAHRLAWGAGLLIWLHAAAATAQKIPQPDGGLPGLSSQQPAQPDPQTLYQQALAALAADQPDQARVLLEQVITLQPRFAGAWLDLALAAWRSGDAAAAIEHLEYLRSQFELPPALSAQVNQWLEQWQTAAQVEPPDSPAPSPAASKASGWYGEVLLGLGYDSNANTGLASQHITLSLPDGSADFELDSAYQPRADRFSQQNLTLGGPSHALLGGWLTPVLFVRSKQLATEHSFSTLDVQPGLLYVQPTGSSGASWQAHLLAQRYLLGGQSLFNGLRLTLQRSQPLSQACQASNTGQIEARWHSQVSSQSASLYSVSAALGCRLPGSGYLSTSLKAGYEQARAERTGGDNRSAEASVSLEQPISARQSLQLSWLYNQTTDQTGYSPLLQNNAVRRLQQHSYSLALRHTLTPAWQAKLSLEYFSQTANLSLFAHQGTTLGAVLAYRFE